MMENIRQVNCIFQLDVGFDSDERIEVITDA